MGSAWDTVDWVTWWQPFKSKKEERLGQEAAPLGNPAEGKVHGMAAATMRNEEFASQNLLSDWCAFIPASSQEPLLGRVLSLSLSPELASSPSLCVCCPP